MGAVLVGAALAVAAVVLAAVVRAVLGDNKVITAKAFVVPRFL